MYAEDWYAQEFSGGVASDDTKKLTWVEKEKKGLYRKKGRNKIRVYPLVYDL